ncbi:MAG: glycerophosphodiester phosphodiesterase family protein [Candidatus Hydrogenedentales bacterium]
MRWICLFVMIMSVVVLPAQSSEVFFQAHRGGLKEVPENTLAAYRYAWDLKAIPEVDICASADNVIICIHDDTLKRTTNADVNQDVPVTRLTFEEIRQWDAGSWFAPEYAGEKVPALEEVLQEMAVRKEAQIYLDLKKVDLKQLAAMIAHYDVAERVIFCHNKIESCQTMHEAVPGLRTMLWIGGKVPDIQKKFRKAHEDGFKGLDQVQLHLHAAPEKDEGISYLMEEAFLKEALEIANEAKIDLEVLPFEFDCTSLASLLDVGIRWYATDEPKRFVSCVDQWREHNPNDAK